MVGKYSDVTCQAKNLNNVLFSFFEENLPLQKWWTLRDPEYFVWNKKNYASNRESTWSKSSPLKAEST